MALNTNGSTPVYVPFSSRQQLLASLALQSTSRLSELVRISNFIFVPDEDQLINVTMADMVDKAHTLADTYFPEWTDRGKSDFGEFLVELFALFSEKDFYYINAFTNEGFLGKATIYSNVVLKAMTNGYMPKLFVSAKCKVNLEFPAGAELIVAPGNIVVSIPNTSLKYSNTEYLTIPQSAAPYFITADFAHGAYQTSTTNFNGKSVRISSKFVDISSITHAVNDTLWTRVNDFSHSASSDKHYMVLPEENGTFQIIYGTSGFGERPSLGSPTTTVYRVGSGTEGNVDNGLITSLSISPTVRPVTTFTQLTPAVGGQDAESIEDIRNHGSVYYRTQESIKGVRDCIEVLNSFPDINKSQALVFANNLYFYVIPESGLAATQEFLDEVQLRIKDQVVDFYIPGGVLTVYVPVTLNVNAYLLTGYDSISFIQQLTDFYLDYTNPLASAEYGKNFTLSDFVAKAIENIPGLQNITYNTVNGAAPADVVVDDHQILQAMTTSDITISIVNVS